MWKRTKNCVKLAVKKHYNIKKLLKIKNKLHIMVNIKEECRNKKAGGKAS